MTPQLCGVMAEKTKDYATPGWLGCYLGFA